MKHEGTGIQVEAEKAVRTLLQFIGENPDRGGLVETPARFVRALAEWTSGYGQDPKAILKTFEDGAMGYDEMIVQTDIPFHSLCEHHVAPFFGVAHIAYIPKGRIVGLSKMARLTDVFARRLQVQERMTTQIAETMIEVLEPLGVGVVIEATHTCMCSRGVNKVGSRTTTSALRGVLKDKPEARAEFFSLVSRRSAK